MFNFNFLKRAINYTLALLISIELISERYTFYGLSISQIFVAPMLIIINLFTLAKYRGYLKLLKKYYCYVLILIAYGIAVNLYNNSIYGAYKIFVNVLFSFLCIGFFSFFLEEKSFSTGILTGLVISNLMFIYNFFTESTPVLRLGSREIVKRATGLIRDTNSSVLVLIMLLALFSRTTGMIKRNYILYWFIIIISVLVGFIAYSRTYGVCIGFWLIINFYLIARRRGKFKNLLGYCILVIGLSYILYSSNILSIIITRFRQGVIRRGSILDSRLPLWINFYNYIKDRSLLVLLGGYFDDFISHNVLANTARNLYPHNSYIDFLLTGGIPYLLWFLFLLQKGCRQIVEKNDNLAYYAAFLITCSIFLMTLSISNSKLLFMTITAAWAPIPVNNGRKITQGAIKKLPAYQPNTLCNRLYRKYK